MMMQDEFRQKLILEYIRCTGSLPQIEDLTHIEEIIKFAFNGVQK